MILETLADDKRVARAAGDQDQENATFKFARALLLMAKSKSAPFRTSFERDWQFLLGENHNPVPKNASAAYRVRNRNQGVRNWLYATCDQKAQMILGARPRRTAIPYGAPIDFWDKWRAQEAIEEELRKMRADQFDEDCLWDAMATGKGYTRIVTRVDPRSGLPRFEFESVDGTRLYWDPSADRLEDSDFLFYEPWTPMPRIREAFPNSWMKVRPKERAITDPDRKRDGRSRTDQELLSGAGYEVQYNKSGALVEKGAYIAYLWIRNEEVENEYTDQMVQGERQGFACALCGDIFDKPHIEPPDLPAGAAPEEAVPSPPQCPACGSEALAPVTIPAQVDRSLTGRKFRYPYGWLCVTCEDGILWEGPNPDKIDSVFPIFEYHHKRTPHRFSGQGEVATLRTAQVNANKNMQQLMDYLRTSTNGVLEYPNRATTYGALSNMPNAKIGLPVQLIGLARYLPPPNFNVQAFVMAEETIRRDFQEMSGITDVVYGIAPQTPTSGKEVMARQSGANTRIDGHIRRFSQYRSARDTALWQLMWQNYRDPRYFPIRNADGEPEMELLAVRSLPRNMKIHVSADVEDQNQSELKIQAVQRLMQAGLVPMSLDLLLPTMGLSTWEAQSLMDRALLMRKEQAAMGIEAPPGGPMGQPTDQPMPNEQPDGAMAPSMS